MDYSTTDVISRIIDLDKQATDIIQNAKSQAEQIASNTHFCIEYSVKFFIDENE